MRAYVSLGLPQQRVSGPGGRWIVRGQGGRGMRVRVWLPSRLVRLKGDVRGIGGRDLRREVRQGQTAALQFHELD